MSNRPFQTRPPYGNCVMLSPDGTVLCRCNMKKIQWYLTRNLAHVTQEDPFTIQLDFKPKGNGHASHPYYVTEKKNICVCCGGSIGLTKHHCVPRCFRRFFPEQHKSHSCHDIVLLCRDCHERYENYADQLKIKIVDQYGIIRHVPMQPIQLELIIVLKAVRALLRHRDCIPPARICELENQIKVYLKKDTLAEEDLLNLNNQCVRHQHQDEDDAFGKRVVDNLTDIRSFVRMWRQHFVDTMNPLFLPDFWSIDHVES